MAAAVHFVISLWIFGFMSIWFFVGWIEKWKKKKTNSSRTKKKQIKFHYGFPAILNFQIASRDGLNKTVNSIVVLFFCLFYWFSKIHSLGAKTPKIVFSLQRTLDSIKPPDKPKFMCFIEGKPTLRNGQRNNRILKEKV